MKESCDPMRRATLPLCYEQLKKIESDDEGLSNKNTELFSRVDT